MGNFLLAIFKGWMQFSDSVNIERLCLKKLFCHWNTVGDLFRLTYSNEKVNKSENKSSCDLHHSNLNH